MSLSVVHKFMYFTTLLAFLFFGNTLAQAQGFAPGEVRIGVQLNPTLSSFSLNDSRLDSDGGRLGLQFGTIVEYGLSEKFSLYTGLRLNLGYGGNILYKEGGNFWPDSDLSDASFRNVEAGTSLSYSMQFVEIPLGMIFYTGEIANTGLAGYIESPSLSLLLNTRSRGNFKDSSGDPETITEDTRFLNLGVGFGLGVIPDWLGNSHLKLGLSYQRVFSDSVKDGRFENGSVEDSKARLGIVAFKAVLMI